MIQSTGLPFTDKLRQKCKVNDIWTHLLTGIYNHQCFDIWEKCFKSRKACHSSVTDIWNVHCSIWLVKVCVIDPVSAAAHQQCALTTLVIKRCIDPPTPPSQLHRSLLPEMQFLFPAGFIYHPQCHWGAITHNGKRGKSSGNKRREQEKWCSLCSCVSTQMDGLLVDIGEQFETCY